MVDRSLFLAPNAPALILLIAVAVTLVLAWRSWRLPPFRGRLSFVWLQSSAAWWALAAALENLALGPAHKLFWAEMAWLGIVGAPIFWLLFVWRYIHGGARVPRRWRWVVAVPPLATWLLALSNDAHHLMYLGARPVGPEPGSALLYTHGFWFYVTTIGLYASMLLSVAVVVNALPRVPELHRRHYLGFLAAMALPWLANVGHVTGTLLLFDFDPTPFSFLTMGGIFYFLVSRRQLFDLLPIAHNTLLDAMPDPVLVLDGQGRVAEANAAARALAGMPAYVIGRAVAELADLREPLRALLAADGAVLRDARLGAAEAWFDISRVPLTHGGRTVGHLLLFRDATYRHWSESRLRQQATQDALTGLHNRRHFEEVRAALLAEARAAGQPLSAILLDLDHFKRLNDTHGHRAGDAVLRWVGAFLLRRVRQSDFVFRLGGEEILVVLPGMPAAQALARIETWRREFAAVPVAVDGQAVAATFSAGVATFPDDAADWEQLLHRADQALYAAKAAGRNRACAARTEELPAG